ncbi:hypothetical protein SO802_004894 [Lithocarpus litseifolius]|uniref:Uncharacterized protein n=1 Tax=Lithocarpus litseifolius TaxID=425828 RepID=A0AAW2DM68_9ROSI
MKCLHIDKVLEKTWNTIHEEVPMNLKELIFSHLQESIKHPEEESDDATHIRTLCSHRGGEALKKCNSSELDWSVKVEFDQSILIWHAATDICYQLDQRKSPLDKSHACKKLINMITQVPPSEVERERSKSVLFDACSLASKLQAISDKKQKWEMISNVWVEMLAYAACHCRGNHHA